jgi:hypothetical protein
MVVVPVLVVVVLVVLVVVVVVVAVASGASGAAWLRQCRLRVLCAPGSTRHPPCSPIGA